MWADPHERWRAFIVAEHEREYEFEGPDAVALLCGWCAAAEFDDD